MKNYEDALADQNKAELEFYVSLEETDEEEEKANQEVHARYNNLQPVKRPCKVSSCDSEDCFEDSHWA